MKKGNNLKHYRLKRKMRREALAVLADMSVQQIRNLEDGKHSPTLNTAHRIARALQIPVIELFPITTITKKKVLR